MDREGVSRTGGSGRAAPRIVTLLLAVACAFSAVPCVVAQEAPTAAEMLERMRAHLAECATCVITGVAEECWLEGGEVDRREQRAFTLHFERAGLRLRVITAKQDGRRQERGIVAVLDGGQLQSWSADEKAPDPVEPAPDGIHEWWVPDEVQTLFEALSPQLLARAPSASAWSFTSTPVREVVDGVDCWRLGSDPPKGAPTGSGRHELEQLWLAVADARPVRWVDQWHDVDGDGRRRSAWFEVAFDATLPADAFALVEPPPDGLAGAGGSVEGVAAALLAAAVIFGTFALLLRMRREQAVALREVTVVLVVQFGVFGVMYLPPAAGEIAMALSGWEALDSARLAVAGAPLLLFAVFYLLRFTRFDYRFQQRRMLWGVAPRHAAQLLQTVAAGEGVELEQNGSRFEDRHTGEEWRVEGTGWASLLLGPRGARERFERIVAAVIRQARERQLVTRFRFLPAFCALQLGGVGVALWFALRHGF